MNSIHYFFILYPLGILAAVYLIRKKKFVTKKHPLADVQYSWLLLLLPWIAPGQEAARRLGVHLETFNLNMVIYVLVAILFNFILLRILYRKFSPKPAA